jgi:hypothetical protein
MRRDVIQRGRTEDFADGSRQLDMFRTAGELRDLRSEAPGSVPVSGILAETVRRWPKHLTEHRDGAGMQAYMSAMHKTIREQGGVHTPISIRQFQMLGGQHEEVLDGAHRINAAPRNMLLPVTHSSGGDLNAIRKEAFANQERTRAQGLV